ncbi:MAG TPA: hypothetical protein DCW74_13635 [Alteromonas australica]|uniref:Uncharacterized protein n=1 Tax=Alteromonas australica TaxID=589873 RepID=A0A350P647_9ALTE|nr:hypothetical protein [Alteromonas australica]|tara:strand:- start:309 stop:782 length:474 start_codon:yes stop_codon:yes gene_type:complete
MTKRTLERSGRDAEQHDKQVRRQPWRPVRQLDTPPPPEGYVYRWIRESMLGSEDRANVSRRVREGFELVRGEELPPEWVLPTMDGSGRHAGVVYNEGLLLAKIPEELVDQRSAYYENMTQQADDALDNNMFNEQRGDRKYVKYEPQRQTNVTFGRRP